MTHQRSTSHGSSHDDVGAGFMEECDRDTRMTAADRSCWLVFRLSVMAAMSALALTAYAEWAVVGLSSVRLYSFEYFLLCLVGGFISGFPHTMVTPIDLLKVRVQVGEFMSIAEGFAAMRQEVRDAPTLAAKLAVPFRGWAPTFIGYGSQGALKFGLYEYFKFLVTLHGGATAARHQVIMFLAASAAAEFCADWALAPWEAVKVRMQTSLRLPPKLEIVMPRMWAAEGLRAFFRGLPPLWCRQIPYTMVKFASFEKTVALLSACWAAAFGHAPHHGLPLLVVTLVAGYFAGALCAIVSHPADTVVSKLNQREVRVGALTLLLQMPCREVWRGLGLRILMVGTLTALQWLFYDGFKAIVGLPTTAAIRVAAAAPSN